MAQNKQIRSLSERAENTFRTLPKCTFDLKSGFWIFFKNIFCMIFFNTRLQLAEEKNRHLFEQVLGKEWNRSSLIRLQTKLSSTFACFGEDNDDTFSPFSGIYIQSSCWESCSVDSQWNSDDFCFFLLPWLDFRELRKMDFSETTEWWRWCWSSSHFTLQNRDPSDRKLFSLMIERLSFEPDGSNNSADS